MSPRLGAGLTVHPSHQDVPSPRRSDAREGLAVCAVPEAASQTRDTDGNDGHGRKKTHSPFTLFFNVFYCGETYITKNARVNHRQGPLTVRNDLGSAVQGGFRAYVRF